MERKKRKPNKQKPNELLMDPRTAALYLDGALSRGDMAVFVEAVKEVAFAQGESIAALSKEAALQKDKVYRTLAGNNDPKFKTLRKLLETMGFQISIRTAIRKKFDISDYTGESK